MTKLTKLIAVMLVATLMVVCASCGKKDKDSTPNSGGGNTPSVRIDTEIYNKLDPEFQFDTDYVVSNKSKFSGTFYSKTDGLLEVWELCGGVSSPKVQKYDFARVPDCVVVEIGTNDYLSSAYTDNFYSNNVKEMVFNLRSVYGSDVKIVWCYGFNSYVDDMWNVTKSTLDALNSDGTIYYCEIPECGLSKEQGGDGLHPDVEISKTMTSALKSFIEENIYK